MKYLYYEEGWIAEVEILQDLSNEKCSKLILKVIKSIGEYLFPPLDDGENFEASFDDDYQGCVGWYINVLSEDGMEEFYI